MSTIRETTGRESSCTVRFTHLIPDGPAATFTLRAYSDTARLPQQFRAIKSVASQTMIDLGSIITHHHAVGCDHLTWYDQQRVCRGVQGVSSDWTRGR